jgi:hypothetical protein
MTLGDILNPRKDKRCLLCGTKRVAVMGIFICTAQPQPDIPYFLCLRCLRKPDTPSRVDALLMRPQGGVS